MIVTITSDKIRIGKTKLPITKGRLNHISAEDICGEGELDIRKSPKTEGIQSPITVRMAP
jgi:hypothetical protein